MTRRDFMKLVVLANQRPDLVRPEEYDPLMGIANHRERRMVSEGGAIAFLRWQAMQFNGLWDFDELENCSNYFRQVDIIA